MDIHCLSVELVESLQYLVAAGKPIIGVVASLKSATLAGLLEYGCARNRQVGTFPPLPATVSQSILGMALSEVPSGLGLRAGGPQQPQVKSLRTRSVEFFAVRDGTLIHQSVEYESFCHRFELASRNVGFSQEAAINLHSALFEMTENAMIHAQSPEGALVGYEVRERLSLFSVVDVGIGILGSLKKSPKYGALTRDVDAVQLALMDGVTSLHGEHGGFGFNSVFKALAEQWGQLRFRSGNGCVTMDGTHVDKDQSRRHFPLGMPGFQVSVCCRSDEFPPGHLVF